MKIILLRHGPPDFKAHWLKPNIGVKRALALYAASHVIEGPPAKLQVMSSVVNICITSTLVGTVDSAQRLGFKNALALALFNESELPCPNTLLVPLPWKVYLLIFRLLWLVGMRLNCPGISSDRKRAREGSEYLSHLAKRNGTVLLIGHGVMNRLLCKALQRSGWQVDEKTGSGYWSSITLSYH